MRMTAGRWAELVSAWETSGQSSRAFADKHGVSESSLRWWKGEPSRRARREPGAGKSRRGIVALAKVVREGEAAPASMAPTPSVVIAVGTARILVGEDFDARLLRAVVHALGEPS